VNPLDPASGIDTYTPTPSETHTPAGPVLSSTFTVPPASTQTFTFTPTVVPTSTQTYTETNLTSTFTESYTESGTFTITESFTESFSATHTFSESQTYTPTYTHTATQTDTPTPDRPVVYSTNTSGMFTIWKMNADGSNATQLTTDGGYWDINPAWARDGSERIAFESDRDFGNREIYVMASDGSGQVNITNSAVAKDTEPEWEPGGSRIVFSSDRDVAFFSAIYIMNDDGSGVTIVTDSTSVDLSPSWSPDGQWIVFTSWRAGGIEVFKVMTDGSNLTQITDLNMPCMFPSWSPDGNTIIFSSTFEGDNPTDYNIFTVDPNVAAPVSVLGDLTQLTDSINVDKAPVYSADGSQIYWHNDQLGDVDIWSMNDTGLPKWVRLQTGATEECPNYRW